MNEASNGPPSGGLTATVNRYAPVVKWGSVALIVLSVALIFRQLRVGPVVQTLEGWIEGLGIWGPLAFALIYVAAVVALIPGSALTLAAGALFGLVGGTVVASLASTMGAALAFLISRYLARDRIAAKLQHSPKFDAIDKAIGESGWKIVALLRVSPAVPFNLQNYLYGLTGIRFWPCVLASWLAMLPGTFVYVYLGHLGRESLEVAVGGAERSRSPAEWTMLIVGLLATIAVTVYITHLARKALQQHSGIAAGHKPEAPARDCCPSLALRACIKATVSAVLALASLAVAGYTHFHPDLFQLLFARLLGPPQVVLREAYEEKPNGPTFDHSTFDALLKARVDEKGGVDYEGFKLDAAKLDGYIKTLADAPFDDMGRSPKLSLLINAYNAFTLRLILDYYPIDTIQSIPAEKRWDDVRWLVGGHTWSLNQIEHEQIRPKFKEPRVHFALVCAAVGCPKLRNEAYQADRIDEQFEDQARYVHTHPRWFQFEPESGVVRLTRLYLWYGGDFRQVAGSVLNFAARYSPEMKRALEAGSKPRIEWLPYDWSLNNKENVG